MPDHADYHWLSAALAHPEQWGDKEHDTIVFLLRQARDSLSTTPQHHRGDVERLRRSIADYEAALTRYEERRRP